MFWNLFKKREEEIKEIVTLQMAEIMARVDVDFKFLQSIQKLEVKDGDIVVLKYGGKLSKTAYENLKKSVEETITGFGFKVHVIIFEEGMDIGVLTRS